MCIHNCTKFVYRLPTNGVHVFFFFENCRDVQKYVKKEIYIHILEQNYDLNWYLDLAQIQRAILTTCPY